MNTVSRGIRNAFRNGIRAVSIVVILGLSIGLSLAMTVARTAVDTKIQLVKTSIGNTITLTPAGSQGFQGGGEPLTTEQLSKVTNLANVTKVTQTLSDRLTSENSSLLSAIEPGGIGNRQSRNSGINFQVIPKDGGQQLPRTFTPPVMITGASDSASASVYGGSSITFTSGQAFDASKNEDVAVIGKALAEKNNLSIGSTFTAYGKAIKVVGIYDSGTAFSNAGVVVPLATLQRLSDQANSITNATVTVSSIDTVDSVVAAIKSSLGNAADVVSNQEAATQAIQPLESVKTISTVSLIGAIIAGAAIILLTMVMVVRERRREIGVLKAIGASNIKVMLQFMSEAVTLTVIALAAGLIIGAAAANPVTKLLVTNSANTAQTAGEPGQRIDEGGGPRRSSLRGFGRNSLSSVRDVQASVGTEILGYGAITALLIAVIGSAIPALLISKIRPSEVMRAE